MNDIKDQFLLRPDITFLNFGSFGACPKPIFADYQRWQMILEQEPVQFIIRDGYDHLEQSVLSLANYVHCDHEDIVFVTNPTYAVNLVVKSLSFSPGDEILTTDLEYGACDRTWEYYCEKTGAKYIKQPISLPITDKETIVKEFFAGYSERTKLVFISQITSATALILPVKEICIEAKKRGLLVFIDGAHVPGHIELNIKELDPDFYTGACHKWIMAPKGCSFLYCKKEWQEKLDPLIISWGYKAAFPSKSKFFDYHQFNGTRDFSAFLTIPACIEFMEEFNWKERTKICKQKVLEYTTILSKELNAVPLAPISTDFYGQISATRIKTQKPLELQRMLFTDYNIEIPITQKGDEIFIRFSYQAFNTDNDMEHLINSLRAIRKNTLLID